MDQKLNGYGHIMALSQTFLYQQKGKYDEGRIHFRTVLLCAVCC